MNRPGRWISLLPILALIPRLGLVIVAADRQQVAPDTRAALLWLSSSALAVLVGLAEVYVGSAVVSRRHGGLAAVWVGITALLNALILPLCLSGLQAAPVWDVLGSRPIQVVWGAGLGLLHALFLRLPLGRRRPRRLRPARAVRGPSPRPFERRGSAARCARSGGHGAPSAD